MTHTWIKTAALLLSIAATPALAQDKASLTVSFAGIKNPNGVIMAGLYNTEAAFKDGEPFKGARLAIADGRAKTVFKGLKPGRYAIKAYHDINGDGRMGTNPFGIPTEPYAASNNAPPRMGPPLWADAVFEVTAGANAQTIAIK